MMVMDEIQRRKENIMGQRADKSQGLKWPAHPLSRRESGTHCLEEVSVVRGCLVPGTW